MAFNMQATPEIIALTQKCVDCSTIDLGLYEKNDVKRGLRDVSGRGVLTGLTHISNVVAFDEIDGKRIPREGLLEYRGININDLTEGFLKEERFGFEEAAYLTWEIMSDAKSATGEDDLWRYFGMKGERYNDNFNCS